MIIRFLFQIAAVLLFPACNNCSYWGRVIHTQCRGVSGSLTKDKITPPYVPPPPPPAGKSYLVPVVSCPKNSAQLCSHYSNGANVIAIALPDAGNGVASTTNVGTLNNCNELWTAWGNGQLVANDVIAVYFNFLDGPNGISATCDDSNGCSLSGGPFTNFNDQGYTDRQPVSVSAGKFLACASIASYGLDDTGNPVNVIPPLGVSFFIPTGTHDFTQPPTAYTMGSISGDQVTNLPMPVSGGTAGAFLQASVTTSQPNFSLSFSSWGDAP